MRSIGREGMYILLWAVLLIAAEFPSASEGATAKAGFCGNTYIGGSNPCLGARLLRDPGTSLVYYDGDAFRFGTLKLGELKAYCAHLNALSLSWHLATVADLRPALRFLAQNNQLFWRDFSTIDLRGPGYVLVTADAQQEMGGVYFDSVYRLYGNTLNKNLNYLGLGTINYSGPSLDTSPLTDNSGNSAVLKVICVAHGS